MDSGPSTSSGFPRPRARETEALANRIYDRYVTHGFVANGIIPIERVIQELGDASIYALPGLKRFFAEGALFRNRRPFGRKFIVFVDGGIADSAEDSYRMVLAEELGHLIVHQPIVAAVKTISDFFDVHRRSDWLQLEDDARAVGRAILMPSALVEQLSSVCYRGVVRDSGFGDYQAFWGRLRFLLSRALVVPEDDVEQRIRTYPGGVQDRIVASFADRSLELHPTRQSIRKTRQRAEEQVETSPLHQLELFESHDGL